MCKTIAGHLIDATLFGMNTLSRRVSSDRNYAFIGHRYSRVKFLYLYTENNCLTLDRIFLVEKKLIIINIIF